MLEKTMKQVFNKNIKQWLKTIDDKSVVAAIEKNLIITGGAFTSLIENKTPNDFDCYFRNKSTVVLIAEYYAKKWNDKYGTVENKINQHSHVMVLDGENPSKEILDYYHITDISQSKAVMISNTPKNRVKMIFPSDGIVGNPEEVNASEELGINISEVVTELDEIAAEEILKKEKEEYFPVFISTNAITLSNKIQLVIRFYGEPDEIHDTYDFEHTKAYYDYGKQNLVIPAKVYECIVNKTLLYSGSKYPVASLFRLRKFIERGWHINAGQILKITLQTNELDLMDINVLEDQLIGVDSVYFMNLIEQFRKSKELNSSFVLTPQYIVSIIDKIF